jgi:hypothetical protein
VPHLIDHSNPCQLPVPPEILEPRRQQLGIAHRMLDRLMLLAPNLDPLSCQPSSETLHVAVDIT